MTALAWRQPEDAPLGVASLSKLAFDGVDLQPLHSQLLDKYVFEPDNAAALMDLATIEQIFGNREDGLARQREALLLRRVYHSPCAAAAPALRLLAFAVPGDIGANTPLEFLLDGSDIALTTLYVVPGEALPETMPEHDVAIVVAGESEESAPALAALAHLVADWPKPVLNRPQLIGSLSRARLPAVVQGIDGVDIPLTEQIERADLAAVATGRSELRSHLADGALPLIARPVGSHAGRGLKKLDNPVAIQTYLAERPEKSFYISRYVDYRSADGLFRKYRVVFIDGRPYACHMAIADQWMIYYLNAAMGESAAKRAEEERFMTGFDSDFGRRHGAALALIAERVGLDYFGIDCAETPDGRLLLFEADIAMIVHLMDSPAIYPYKAPQMRKVFAAFCALLKDRAARVPRRKADAAA